MTLVCWQHKVGSWGEWETVGLETWHLPSAACIFPSLSSDPSFPGHWLPSFSYIYVARGVRELEPCHLLALWLCTSFFSVPRFPHLLNRVSNTNLKSLLGGLSEKVLCKCLTPWQILSSKHTKHLCMYYFKQFTLIHLPFWNGCYYIAALQVTVLRHRG